MRDIIIRDNTELQIDFFDKNTLKKDEGEVTIYLYYENYDRLFKAVEEYVGICIDEWTNYSSNGWYPLMGETDLTQSWRKFKIDFAGKAIPLPSGFEKLIIPAIYWEGLYNGEIKVDDSIEVIREWLGKKMLK